MALSFFLLTLVIGQVVYCAPQKKCHSLFCELVSKCNNLTNKMLNDCSNSTVIYSSKITDRNKQDVLCTILLHNMIIFREKINTCNVSILFPLQDDYNRTICEQPEFMVTNQTNKQNASSLKCMKLCIDWDEKVDPKCSLAHYYKTSSTYIETKKNETGISQSNKKEKQLLGQKLHNDTLYYNSDNPVLEKKNFTRESSIKTVLNNSIHENDKKKIGESYGTKNYSEDNLSSKIPNGLEKNTDSEEIKDDIKENVGGKAVSEIEEGFKENSNKEPANKNKKDNKDLNKSELIKKSQLLDNENENVFGDDESTNNENQDQELNRNGVGKMEKPNMLAGEEPISNINTDVDGESYFFSYFMVVCILFVMGYVFYHNRAKVMAIIIEGKRNKKQFRNGRPNSANYHKLDSNLEEALTSTCNKNSNQIIF